MQSAEEGLFRQIAMDKDQKHLICDLSKGLF